VIGIHLPVEKINAGDSHSFDNGINLGRIAAFGKIGNAFNESLRHGKRIAICVRSYNRECRSSSDICHLFMDSRFI
jgi:hypothetical protein